MDVKYNLSMLSSIGYLSILLQIIVSMALLQAIKIALQKLNEGCSIEEAKAICDPEIIRQIFIWQVETSYPKYLFIVLFRHTHSYVFI